MFPVGVDTITVQAGPAFDAFGEDTKRTVTIRPVFGGLNQIVWDATGEAFSRVKTTMEGAGEVLEAAVPVVDQAGWVDGAGNAVTMWGYEAKITATDPDDSRNTVTWRKMFQPVSADGATFDLDRVPDSTDGSPALAPTVKVPVPGPTGPAGGSDAAQAEWLRTGPLSKQALADELADEASPAHGELITAIARGLPFEDPAAYVLATFRSVQQDLMVYTSKDGKDFANNLQNPVHPNATDSVRDPSIIYHRGYYYAAITAQESASPTGTSFDILRSASPTAQGSWAKIATVDCTAATVAADQLPSGLVYTWAPEFFIDDDGSVHIYVSINQQNIFHTTATNDALTTWSAPTKVTFDKTGSGLPSVTTYLDASVVRIGPKYHMVYKVNNYKRPAHAVADAPGGPFQDLGYLTWPGFVAPTEGDGYEGPNLIRVGQQRWRLYMDHTPSTGLVWSENTTPDLDKDSWSAPSSATIDGVANASALRHGTVLPIGSAKAEATVKAQRILSFSRKVHTSGNITVVNSTWQHLDGAADCVLDCEAGDWVQLTLEAAWNTTGGEGNIDFATILGGSAGTANNFTGVHASGGIGYSAGFHTGAGYKGFFVADFYKVVASDIEAGKVRFGVYARANGGSRILLGDGSNGWIFTARKVA